MGPPFWRFPSGAALSVAPLIPLAVSGPNNLNIFDTVSPPADAIRSLFFLVIGITGAIFVLVEGMLLYSVFRFRQRNPGTTAEPPQLYGSKPVEVAWTLAPLLIVFVLFMVVARTIAEVKLHEPPPGIMRVTVVGHQWWWEYKYPKQADHPELGDGFITANELHVPAGQAVWFDLESADVVHSFWFPRLNGKTDVVPGRTNATWFLSRQEGTFLGQCTEYCGMQHANMILRMEADSPDKFGEWLKNQRKLEVWAEAEATWIKGHPGRTATLEEIIPDGATREGRAVFLANACMNCHTVRGTTAKGTFGPDLTHLASRQTLASAMVPNDTANLKQWVEDPQVIKPGCWMPAMKLDGRQRDLVVKYLQSLK